MDFPGESARASLKRAAPGPAVGPAAHFPGESARASLKHAGPGPDRRSATRKPPPTYRHFPSQYGLGLHGAKADGSVVFRRKPSRRKVLGFIASQPPWMAAARRASAPTTGRGDRGTRPRAEAGSADLWVHEDDVRHGDEGRDTGDDLAAEGGSPPLRLEVLQRRGFAVVDGGLRAQSAYRDDPHISMLHVSVAAGENYGQSGGLPSSPALHALRQPSQIVGSIVHPALPQLDFEGRPAPVVVFWPGTAAVVRP